MNLISATQIDLANTCLRRWGFRYLTDLPKPDPGPGAELGQRIHKVAEDYLKYGKSPVPDTLEGEVFMSGMKWLPSPGKGDVEGRQKIEIGGIWYVLIIDCVTFGDQLPEWNYGSIPVILDHKTSINPKKYGLTETTLLEDPQALIYDMYMLNRFPISTVGMRWVYYKTKGRSLSYPVDTVVSSDLILSNFSRLVHPVSEQLVELYQTRPEPNSLQCNPLSCYKYNKECPYKRFCKVTVAEHTAALGEKYLQGEKQMVPSIKDRFNQQQAAQPNPGFQPQQQMPPPRNQMIPPGNQMSTSQQQMPPPGQIGVPPQVGSIQPGNAINPPVPGRTLAPPPQTQPLPHQNTTIVPQPLPQQTAQDRQNYYVENPGNQEAVKTILLVIRQMIDDTLAKL